MAYKFQKGDIVKGREDKYDTVWQTPMEIVGVQHQEDTTLYLASLNGKAAVPFQEDDLELVTDYRIASYAKQCFELDDEMKETKE